MKRFTGLLQNINSRLTLPQPEKSRVILEIAADMEGLFSHYVEKGLTESEATEKVRKKFDFSDEALSQLVDIHESFIQKFLNKLPAHPGTGLEKTVLTVLVTLIIFSFSYTLVTRSFFTSASVFIWPIFGIGFAAILLSVFNFYRLYIKKEYRFNKIRTDLTSIFFLGGLIIFTSIWGYFFEHFIHGPTIPVSSLISILFLENLELVHNNLMVVTDALLKSTSVITTGLFVLVIIGFLLLSLTRKLHKIEYAEAMLYLNN